MITTMLAFALGLAGCSENGFHHNGDAAGMAPDIEVDPGQLTYGTLSTGEEEVQTFTVRNVGTADLTVEGIEIDNASFVVLSEPTAFTLPPGAEQTVDVAFSPMGANEQVGVASVFSDDPDESAALVDLIGQGAVPELEIEPDPYDFGVDYIGCGNGHDFSLTNVGTDDLVIERIKYTPDAEKQLTLTDANVLPLTLAPGQQTSVRIDFLPQVEGAITGELAVTSNDPRGVVVATQTAEGQYVGENEDEFDIPEEPPVDIVFLVDRSCSMDDDAANLANNFSKFISTISTYTTDWRIGVVTKDSGCFNNGILKSTTSDYETKFEQAVKGSSGSYTEALLTLAANAMKETASGGCNENFLRSGAMLHMIMVSDEVEQSSKSWSSYVSTLQGYPDDPSLLKLSAVAGDYPSGCSSADPGIGYYEAVSATGGEYLSICDTNWSKHVETLATASMSLSSVTLTETPDPDTIRVWVAGDEWFQPDWSYESSTNKVTFDAALPDGGGKVRVKYSILANCD